MGKIIELNAGMGPAILNHLRQYSDLPDAGIVAGQAVASAVLDLYGPGGGIYNDIDVFHNQMGPRERAGRLAQQHNPTVSFCAPTLPYDRYGHLHHWSLRDIYHVRESWREGMINHVSVSAEVLTPYKIISAFDINCTRAGVDLATGQFAWTPEFEYFLNTHQLEIAALQTPYHSSIRLVKKMAEMPWAYVDMDLNMELCSLVAAQYPEWFHPAKHAPRELAKRFGKKHADEYQQHQATLDRYFELVKERHGLHSLRPRAAPDKSLVEVADRLGPAVLVLGPRVVYASRRKAPAALQAKKEIVQKASSRQEIRLQADMLGMEYLRGQVTDRHVREVEGLISKHPFLLGTLVGLTLDEQFQVKKRLVRLANEKGEWIYGVVETTATANDLRTDEALTALLEKNQATLGEKLIEEKFPAQTILGCQVRELVTQLDLKIEGETMRHCVGGYARSVQSGRSHIISLRRGRDRQYWSTAEVSPGKKGWKIAQHKAYRNGEPHWRNHLALLWLVERTQHGRFSAFFCVPTALVRQRASRWWNRHIWQLRWKVRNWWYCGYPGRLRMAGRAFWQSWKDTAPHRPPVSVKKVGPAIRPALGEDIDIPF